MLDLGGFGLFVLANFLVVAIAIMLIVLVDRVEIEYAETIPITFSVTIGLMGLYATVHNAGLLF